MVIGLKARQPGSRNILLFTTAQHERMSDSPVVPMEEAKISYLNSTGGLKTVLKLERKVEFMPQHETRPDSPGET